MRRCFAATLGAGRTAKGTVTFWVELTPEGRVFDARVREATWPDPEGQRCALAAVRALTFPPPVNGTQTVSMPFALEAEP